MHALVATVSERTAALLALLAAHHADRRAPTLRELRAWLGWSSLSVVDYHLVGLWRLGFAEWEPHGNRTLRLTAAGLAAAGYDPSGQPLPVPVAASAVGGLGVPAGTTMIERRGAALWFWSQGETA